MESNRNIFLAYRKISKPASKASTVASRLQWTCNSVLVIISTPQVKVDGPFLSSTLFCTPLRLASSSPKVTLWEVEATMLHFGKIRLPKENKKGKLVKMVVCWP